MCDIKHYLMDQYSLLCVLFMSSNLLTNLFTLTNMYTFEITCLPLELGDTLIYLQTLAYILIELHQNCKRLDGSRWC